MPLTNSTCAKLQLSDNGLSSLQEIFWNLIQYPWGSNISIVAQKEWSKDHARIQLVRQNPERKQSQAFKNVQDAEPFASKALDTWEASQKERSHHVALLTTEPQRVPPSSDVRRELPSPWVNLGGKEGPSAGAPEVLTGSLRSTFMRGDQRYPPWSQ